MRQQYNLCENWPAFVTKVLKRNIAICTLYCWYHFVSVGLSRRRMVHDNTSCLCHSSDR